MKHKVLVKLNECMVGICGKPEEQEDEFPEMTVKKKKKPQVMGTILKRGENEK